MKLFKKTRELEGKITLFLINIIQSGVLLTRAFERYFRTGVSSDFLALKDQVSRLEAENDAIRREVEKQLYAQMLLPDMRSDILHILEGSDKIINKYETDLILLSIEQPSVPKRLEKKLMRLIITNTDCVSALISGIKLALNGAGMTEIIEQVSRLEHQADLIAIELKQIVFQKMQLPLARQLQLKEFIYSIEKISDMAEDMADVLSIFAVKHSV